jgi:predicted transglutaminase-like cysteine proteinase
LPITDAQYAQLEAVNERMNAEPYVPDNPIFGEAPDTWKFRPDGKGWVCRDYAEAKADTLIKAGWPKAELRLVLCYTEPVPGFPAGEYHAVMTAEAGGATWVLDNRAGDVYEWDQPPFPYRWALRQVAGTDGFLDISLA